MALIDYNNGTATISVNGGQPPFSYLLKQGGVAATHDGANFVNPIVSSNQSVVFGDSSDLTGSYGMPSGTYTCEITDNNGCIVTTSEIVISQTEEATTTQATAATTLATAATTLATIPTTPATDATTLATAATTIATNATTLATNATTIATDPTTLATNATTLATNATTIATNATTIATNATTIATDPTTLATTLAPTYTTFTGPATRLEGQTVSYVLNGTNIPDGTQVGYTITGVDLSDISLSSLTGFITMNNFMGNQQAGQLQFSCLDDNNYEGSETMVITLNNQDEAGNTTGLTPTLFIETIVSDLATTTLPTFTCDDANFTVNTGVENTGVSATSTGVPTLIVPAHYVLGVNSYTATITVPATDAWGTAYSNAGGSIECTAVGVGIVATTLATDATTLATDATTLATDATTLATDATTEATAATTQATAAPEDLYWFHTGESTWPYSKDLMSDDPQYFPPDGTNQSNSTPKFKQTFADMLNNPSGYEAVNSTLQFNTGTQLVFDASIGSSYYWILIPDSMGIPDLTQTAGLADTQNNTSDVAHSKMTMEVGGNPYTLYRVNLLSSTSGVTIEYTL